MHLWRIIQQHDDQFIAIESTDRDETFGIVCFIYVTCRVSSLKTLGETCIPQGLLRYVRVMSRYPRGSASRNSAKKSIRFWAQSQTTHPCSSHIYLETTKFLPRQAKEMEYTVPKGVSQYEICVASNRSSHRVLSCFCPRFCFLLLLVLLYE